jgi:hypothetical protein
VVSIAINRCFWYQPFRSISPILQIPQFYKMDSQQLLELLAIENKIKQGAETMLQVIDSSQIQARQNVEETLDNTNQKIKALNTKLQSVKGS